MAIRLLVCTATLDEVRTFARDGEASPLDDGTVSAVCGPIALAVTGVGIPLTLLRLPPLLTALQPEAVLNLGIAGAYPNSGLSVGDIAVARSETIGDIGFELPEEPGFQPVSIAPFGAFYRRISLRIPDGMGNLPANLTVRETDGCTVSCCTGALRTGLQRERLFNVGIESMEGAAVALACSEANIPVSEVRAISNIAADRDMRPENITLALANLGDYLQAYRDCQGI